MNIREYEKLFKLLGSKRRLAIIVYLLNKKEATVNEIATKIKLSFKATSKHLILLANADILDFEQRNLLVFYCISSSLPKNIKNIISSISNSRE